VRPEIPAVFVWLAKPPANVYSVRFFRGDKLVLQRESKEPRFTLPLRWRNGGKTFRLEPGTYRWDVRPATGPPSRRRWGEPIVRSKWAYVP
jgi:hypothetical protein